MDQRNTQPRNKLVAAVLNLFVFGLGYLYAGRGRRAAAFLFGYFAINFFFGICGLLSTWTGFAANSFFLGGLKFFTVIDVFLIANRNPQPTLRKYMEVPVYVLYAVLVTASIHMLLQYRADVLGYDTLTITDNYLSPTVMQNDYVLIDTGFYNRHPPIPNDIIVIREPLGSEYTRRIKNVTSRGVVVLTGNGGTELFPLNSIVGRPTTVFYSTDPDRIGQDIAQPPREE